MRIGYACLALGVYHSDYKTVRLANLSKEKLIEIIDYNLESLSNMIEYNYKNNIKLFRITSDLIPFGSKTDLGFDWENYYKDKVLEIGNKIKAYDIKVSMHPGQYTVINSPDDKVVNQSIEELVYHAKILNLLGMHTSSKMVLHIGGVYGNKEEAMKRFINNFHKAPIIVKERLVIENDEKSYNIEEVLYISSQTNIPVIFDNLHHDLNPPKDLMNYDYWLKKVHLTWKKEDGVQKIHYSEQALNGKRGAHSFTIDPKKFMNFINQVTFREFDIMLEVKDKNLSAIKINNILNEKTSIKDIEKEWARYKYSILAYSPKNYQYIRELLKNKTDSNKFEFYKLIDESLTNDKVLGHEINALSHVWGYFKESNIEENYFKNKLEKISNNKLSVDTMKKKLYALAYEYNIDYLMNSYYFDI